MNQHDYKCPKCGDTDGLRVVATTRVWLAPDGVESSGEYDWDGDSPAECECGWTGTVRDIETESD